MWPLPFEKITDIYKKLWGHSGKNCGEIKGGQTSCMQSSRLQFMKDFNIFLTDRIKFY